MPDDIRSDRDLVAALIRHLRKHGLSGCLDGDDGGPEHDRVVQLLEWVYSSLDVLNIPPVPQPFVLSPARASSDPNWCDWHGETHRDIVREHCMVGDHCTAADAACNASHRVDDHAKACCTCGYDLTSSMRLEPAP